MRPALAAALALAAATAFPAPAWAGHVRTPECPQELCAAIAADGSRVAFPFAEELTPGVRGPEVYEWSAGRLRALVSIPKGAPHRPAIGLDGASTDLSHVFVETSYSLAPEDVDGGLPDIYDVGGATPVLVSTGPLDAAGGGASLASYAGASADGSRVFFSGLSPFVAEESGTCSGVYERAGGVTGPIATAIKPQEPLPQNLCHSLAFGGVSGDGSHLFFTTSRDMVPDDEGGDDIYQRVGSTLSIVTTYPEPATNCVDLPKFAASSADGRTVLFATNTAISPEDTDEAFDVYKREPDGSFVLVSRGTEGGSGCGFGGDRAVALSADGTVAIFETRARLSPADTDSSNDLYRAQEGQAPVLISTGPTDPNADEQSKVFPDWVTDVSSDGLSVAFETKQPLVAADHDRSMDVYVNANGTTELASTGPVRGGAAAAAELLGLSDDGQTVVFATKGRLTDSDLDRDRDIYLRRVAAKRTLLLSGEEIPPRMRVARSGRLRASGSAVVRVACPKTETSGPCHGNVTLSRGKKRLGRAPFQVAAGRRGPVSVHLPRSFSPARPVRVLARVRGVDRLGNASLETASVRLALGGGSAGR
ncbi:MAG TPA: hypothetical protein VGF09_03490 [Solirubrobacterales bacterium]